MVVGGSSEIGAATARALRDAGLAPVLWGRDEVRLQRAAASCGGSARRVDVTVAAEVAHALAAIPDPLRAVVYAAGLFDWGDADEGDPSAWEQLFAVNLVAAATLTRLALPRLLDAAPSTLILIGSGAAHEAFPHNAAYVASKHGLAGLARATWLDVRNRGVKVSLVSPGLVAAGAGRWSPQGQERPETLLQPEDVAAAVRFVVDFPARGCPTEIRLQPQAGRW